MLQTAIVILLLVLLVVLVLYLLNRYVLTVITDPKTKQFVVAILALIGILVILGVAWPRIASL